MVGNQPNKRHPLYLTWKMMRDRCNNARGANYKRYGGRGIQVCSRWDSFDAFVADMGPRPAGCTLDRIQNDGNYDPGNCRWADAPTQRRNSSRVVMVTHDGKTQCLRDWTRELGLCRNAMYHRVHRYGAQRAVEMGRATINACKRHERRENSNEWMPSSL